MLLLVPAIVIPLLLATAKSPSLSVDGGPVVAPGATIVLNGTAFAPNSQLSFSWDDQAVGWLATAQTNESGKFSAQITIPVDTATGAHRLSALGANVPKHGQNPEGKGQSRRNAKGGAAAAAPPATEWQVIATLTVEVVVPQTSVAPTPTQAPATPAPTAKATTTSAPATPAPTASTRPQSSPSASPPPGSGSGSGAAVRVVGYGAGTTGGSGGRVYTVSTWSQFKTAVLASGPRIVDVTGGANLDGGGERLVINNGDLTIDGSGWSGSLKRYSLVLRASNVIITQMRLRPGDQIADVGEGDGLTINPGDGASLSNVVIDHCSLLWAPDVTLAILNRSMNITVQHSIIAAGLVYSANPSSPNGYGANVTTIGQVAPSQYGAHVTFYRNYLAHNNQRNLRGIGTLGIEYVNNVFYNWGSKLGHANPQGMNVVGNVFRKGPDTVGSDEVYVTQVKNSYPRPFADSVWWADNLGLGFTPTMDFGNGVRRTGPWDGGLHGVSAAPASGGLADTVVNEAGPSLVDTVDGHLKHDWATVSGSFYNGAGYAGPNPSWP